MKNIDLDITDGVYDIPDLSKYEDKDPRWDKTPKLTDPNGDDIPDSIFDEEFVDEKYKDEDPKESDE